MKSIIVSAAVLLLLASAGSAVAQNRNGGGNAPGSECSDIMPNLPWHLIPRKCQIELGGWVSRPPSADETAVGAVIPPPPEPSDNPPMYD
jgi:hypothetical protein